MRLLHPYIENHMSDIRFDDKTIIITGGAGGLGRAFARLLGSRGANLVINDLGSSVSGEGSSASAAEQFVDEIGRAHV